jgi:hypothetical protein
MYTITRQLQWPEGIPVVEISDGDIDYTNPDALATKYPGEFETFDDPIETVDTAIEICKSWRGDGEKKARIGIGATGGMTMPFDTCTFKDAKQWAKDIYKTLEKCPACNAIVENLKEWWQAGLFTSTGFFPYDDGYKYCSEHCAEKASEFEQEESE